MSTSETTPFNQDWEYFPHQSRKTNKFIGIRNLLVMCGHAAVRIPSIFGVFDHQTFVLGYLETANSSHKFSAAEGVQVIKKKNSLSSVDHIIYCTIPNF